MLAGRFGAGLATTAEATDRAAISGFGANTTAIFRDQQRDNDHAFIGKMHELAGDD